MSGERTDRKSATRGGRERVDHPLPTEQDAEQDAGERLSLRLEPKTVKRVDALRPVLSTRVHRVHRAEVLRLLVLTGLDIYEEKSPRAQESALRGSSKDPRSKPARK